MLSKRELKLIGLVCIIAMTFYFLDIRVCIFFNIFKIPCVGCGLTRAIKALLSFKILESIKYNILGTPLFIAGVVYIVLYLFKKNDVVDLFFCKHSKIMIAISVMVFLIVWIVNINNPILYN